jgi:ribosomal protein S18 acetylase RimI-like enzyme
MRQQDLRAGWRSEFIRHHFDAEVQEQPDCIVVRTPSNPTYYWGNCLVLPKAPADADLAHWLARFDTLIAHAQPQSQHVAIGVDAEFGHQALPSWLAAGFDISVNCVLQMTASDWQASAARTGPLGQSVPDAVVRPIDFPNEVNAVIELECLDDMPFEINGYRAYRQQQFVRHALMHTAGRLLWFGLWAGGQLLACCGLLRNKAWPSAGQVTGRFQHVLTHPAWRGRGVCTAMIRAVTHHAFARWGVDQLLLLAEPEEAALRIYQRLGYAPIESLWQLQRNAPADRAA